MLYPDYYFNSVKDISVEFLNKNSIKGLILDVDNTLIDVDEVLLDGVISWHEEIINSGIKTIILSNSSKTKKVKKVADSLKINYINFARKPFKGGFLKAKDALELDEGEIAAVGDQIFTDVIGANRCKMISILVKPVDPTRDFWYTKWKRPIENSIINRFLNRTKEEG